jgi:hypothetical protein
VSVSIKKIAGIDSVNVTLNRGLVSIKLKPQNRVTLEEVREAIEHDAFTPKDARVVAVGKFISEGGNTRFEISGSNETFPVARTPHQSWQEQVGQVLTVNGLILAPTSRGKSGTLQITDISG